MEALSLVGNILGTVICLCDGLASHSEGWVERKNVPNHFLLQKPEVKGWSDRQFSSCAAG